MSTVKKRAKVVLTDAQKQMYASERLTNFRWVAKVTDTYSDYTLTEKDLADENIFIELAEIGQFTELANHNVVPIGFLFKNFTTLMKPDFPLEHYNALENSILISDFFGKVAHLHGYVAYQPRTKQVIVAISGTSTTIQAIQDIRFLGHRLKSGQGIVHSGFWAMFKGIRPFILEGIRKAFEEHDDIEELVVTGHSMGGAVAYLLLIDQLFVSKDNIIPPKIRLKLVVFGPPRPGDADLARHYQELADEYRKKNGSDAFSEYLVKAYNDGVPSLPPLFLGYRHCTQSPLYYDHSHLYHIPSSESEYASFHAAADISKQYPRGGHNYYNGRDQERLLRRLGWLEKSLAKGGTGAGAGAGAGEHWEERYLEQVKRQSSHWYI